MPMIPKIQFGTVDVRDVSRAHIKAMTLPQATGKYGGKEAKITMTLFY